MQLDKHHAFNFVVGIVVRFGVQMPDLGLELSL